MSITIPATAVCRREHDFLGAKDIPADAYWGVHSARAVDNFPISGQTVATMPELVRAAAHGANELTMDIRIYRERPDMARHNKPGALALWDFLGASR